MVESSPSSRRVWRVTSNILEGNLMMVYSCCQKCIMISNHLGHFESKKACIEVYGALQVAHLKVCMSNFGFVINSHSVIHRYFNEKSTFYLTLLYHPANLSS